MKVRRGETLYQTFPLPINMENIANLYVSYSQNDKLVLEKKMEDVIIEDNEVAIEKEGEEPVTEIQTNLTLHLSQEDTLSFTHYPAEEKNIVLVQIRLLATNGDAYTLPIHHMRVYKAIKNEVITSA